MLCSDVPDAPNAPTIRLGTLDLIIVDWNPPGSDGGSPVLGYKLFMKKNSDSTWVEVYDGQQNPTVRTFSVTTFNSATLEVTSYDFYVMAKNWVGESDPSATVTYAVTIDTSPSNSQLSGDGSSGFEASVDASISVQAYDTSNTAISIGGDYWFITVTNQCAQVDAFYCEPVSNAVDLVGNGTYKQLTDNSDGSYDGTYTVDVDGVVTLSVFIAKNGGLWA